MHRRRWARLGLVLAVIALLVAGLGIVVGRSDGGRALVAQVRQWITRSPDSGVLGKEVKRDDPDEGKPAGSRRLRELARLRERSQAKVIAEAQDVTVHWNADRTQIQTTTRLKTVEVLDGQAPAEVTVTEPGGEIGDLGLSVSHATHWQPGERAFTLLGQRGGRHHVVGGERGKFRLEGRRIPELNLSVDQAAAVAKTGQIGADIELAAAAAPPEETTGRLSSQFVLQSYRWTASTVAPIPYRVNPAGQPAGVSADAFTRAVAAAFGNWSQPSRNTIAFAYQGQSLVAESANDGQNVIFWGPIDTPGVLGRALCWYNPQSGVAIDCDVIFDPFDYAWSVADQPGATAIDFESVALHEFGHFIGLSHSADPAAVMFPSITAGTKRRVPAPDDIGGLTSVYGSIAAASPPTAVPLPPTATPPGPPDPRQGYFPLIRRDNTGQ